MIGVLDVILEGLVWSCHTVIRNKFIELYRLYTTYK